MAAVLTTDVNPGQSKSFSNGNIVVSATKVTESKLAPVSGINNISASGDIVKRATYQRTVTEFGIEVFQTTNWVQYVYNGTTIKEIQGYDAYTSINLNPTVTTEWDGKMAWGVGTNTVNTCGDVHYGFFYKDIGIRYANATIGLWVNVANNTSSGYFNEL
ncbi:hypothetical protein ACPUYX_13580 [Desulfosporosinus sp. SYSU MS00001]|uniref:hypothetical protein n=1 Tax=Desulfosporosinus sp. SYSU MS00001 TaxID=3416284 RepID=UPI003CF52DFB